MVRTAFYRTAPSCDVERIVEAEKRHETEGALRKHFMTEDEARDEQD
jgi:hypothetical protein